MGHASMPKKFDGKLNNPQKGVRFEMWFRKLENQFDRKERDLTSPMNKCLRNSPE